MMKKIKQIVILILCVLLSSSIKNGRAENTQPTKGGQISMETYFIGRFSMAVPSEMEEAKGSRSHKLRHVEIKEVVWPEGIKQPHARESEWNTLIGEIAKISPHWGSYKSLIRTQDFPDIGRWTKGVFFHDQNDSEEEGTWKTLMDAGKTAVWLTGLSVLVEKENKSNIMVENIRNIGKSYHTLSSNTQASKDNWFYLKHGAINLPYMWQEESDVRFEGHPLDLTIRVRMHETYSVRKAGLIEKTMAAIVTGYAMGLKMDKIRSHKRTVAGLEGEEEVLRQSSKDKTSFNFVWEYGGKVDSGEHPRIVITMDCDDGHLDEKLKIWDAVLDSMKPMYDQKN